MNREVAIFLGSLIFKLQPHFSKDDESMVKKTNQMRKKILYNVSNIVIEKLIDENLSFKVLLKTFLNEEKDKITKGKHNSAEEYAMYEEVT